VVGLCGGGSDAGARTEQAVIVSLHVATGAAAGAASGSRLTAILLGPILHLAGDRLPHQDIGSRRFEIASGLVCLVLSPANAARSIRRLSEQRRAPPLILSTSYRFCAHVETSCFTAATVGTDPVASRLTCSSCWLA
jgi:hypothetical protein